MFNKQRDLSIINRENPVSEFLLLFKKVDIKSQKVQLHGRQLLLCFTAAVRWFIYFTVVLQISLTFSLSFALSHLVFFSFLAETCELFACLRSSCPVCDFSMLHFPLPFYALQRSTTQCPVNFLRSAGRLPHLSENLALPVSLKSLSQ